MDDVAQGIGAFAALIAFLILLVCPGGILMWALPGWGMIPAFGIAGWGCYKMLQFSDAMNDTGFTKPRKR